MPPTEAAVEACLEWALMPPDQLIGIEPVREQPITAEKLAINAVMAGCLPMHFPVVATAWQAMMQDEFLLHGVTVQHRRLRRPRRHQRPDPSRDRRQRAPSMRWATAIARPSVIGRAIRLALINLMDVRPGGIDRSTLGHPGKFSYCLAEDEEDTTWQPLSVVRGMPQRPLGRHRDGGDGAAPDHERVDHRPEGNPRDVRRRDARQPASLLDLRRQLRDRDPQAAARALSRRRAGPSATSPNSSTSARASAAANGPTSARAPSCATAPTSVYPALESPDHLLVVAAGGPAGGFGAVIPPWMGSKTKAVTAAIGACVDCEPPKG